MNHSDIAATYFRNCTEEEVSSRHSEAPLRLGLTVALCTYVRPQSLRRLLDSIDLQERQPDEIIVVDASPDGATEEVVREWAEGSTYRNQVLYFRVTGGLKGLTRQRNFALSKAGYDLLAFFDDDVVFRPGCLRELEATLRNGGSDLVGAGAWAEGGSDRIPMLWRVRRWLGIVSSLRPGSYSRSGFSISWDLQGETDEVLPADWLSGCAACWRTDLARKLRYSTHFEGYSAGEDLEFSLRMRRHGRLVLVGRARLLHLQEPAGRPRCFEYGFSSLRNAYYIHRTCLVDRRWWDALLFIYARWSDTLLRTLITIVRFDTDPDIWRFLMGRYCFLLSLFRSGRGEMAKGSSSSRACGAEGS